MSTTNGILEILFSVGCPLECNSVLCQQRFMRQVDSRISQTTSPIDLFLTSTDGNISKGNMNLCAFKQTASGMYMSFDDIETNEDNHFV